MIRRGGARHSLVANLPCSELIRANPGPRSIYGKTGRVSNAQLNAKSEVAAPAEVLGESRTEQQQARAAGD